MCLRDFIAFVPDVIWSGVIASILTLSGVLISNWSSTNRLLRQLKHDADEKEKDRKSTLRREVYLQAAEEIVKTTNFLTSLPQADFTKPNPENGLLGLGAAVAKLQLISDSKTSLLAGELMAAYGEAFLKLLSMVQPIHSLQTDISIRDEHYTRSQSEVTRVLAEMAHFNETAQKDGEIFSALTRSFEFNQKTTAQIATERNDLWAQRNTLHLAYSRESLQELKRLSALQIPVMVAIRGELGLENDSKALTEQMESQWKRMESQINSLLDSLKNT